MQTFGLPAGLYRAGRLASRLAAQPPQSEAVRRDALARWHAARKAGLTAQQAAQAVGVSRAQLYRWDKDPRPKSRAPKRPHRRPRAPALVAAVQALREDNPAWGKRKIGPVLRRQGFAVSDSTVGRILSALLARGAILAVRRLKAPGARARKIRRKHAKRLSKALRPNRPGQVVQVDTLSVQLRPGSHLKQFCAIDPVTKLAVAMAASRATANNASRFLDKLITALPYPVEAIQVDGGSEFMAAFEQACADKGITLWVLPPRSPEMNGCVERMNGTWRTEFYACFDLPTQIDQINPFIDSFTNRYNRFRPHDSLDQMTPIDYLSNRFSNQTPASHHP